MKEATGELNMTVITVVAIAAVAAFFYAFVWPSIKTTIQRNNKCANTSYCEQCNGKTCQCYYIDDDGKEAGPITCPDSSSSGGQGTGNNGGNTD